MSYDPYGTPRGVPGPDGYPPPGPPPPGYPPPGPPPASSKRPLLIFVAVTVVAVAGAWFWTGVEERRKDAEIDRRAEEFCESVSVTPQELAQCDN